MVFLFLLDVVCSIICKCVFKIGTWVVYKSYDGIYYLYNNKSNKMITETETDTEREEMSGLTDLSPYVIITEEEYDNLKNGNKNSKVKDLHKRNVTSLTKKMVASNQEWKCGTCGQILDFTYEIDHHIPLFKGGTNDVSNLIALCRNCHGKKTLIENNNIL